MAGNQPTLLLKSQNNINLYKKFNSQLNLTKIFAKYAYWQASTVEPELGTAQPQLVSLFIRVEIITCDSLQGNSCLLFKLLFMVSGLTLLNVL